MCTIFCVCVCGVEDKNSILCEKGSLDRSNIIRTV